MKRVKKYILYGGLLALAFSTHSCKKFLDNNYDTGTGLNDATQWASEANADIYLNDVYNQLPDIYSQAESIDNMTDDNDAGYYYSSYKFKQGSLDAGSQNYALFGGGAVGAGAVSRHNWQAAFNAIRRCNTFIQKINENKGNFSPAWFNKRLDEARFHRAYHYSTLFLLMGGLPLIYEPQTRLDTINLYKKRSTYAETFNFLVSTMDTILNNKYLAVKYNKGQNDAGRVTLGAALMLKGYLQLTAASPTYNSTTAPGGSDPNKVAGFGNVDNTRWAAAAASFKKFMDDWGGTGKPYNLFPEDSTLWYEANEYNSEVIFDRVHVPNIKGSNYEQYGGPVYVLGTYYTWGNYNPTQELVDEFEMANGKRITDPTSGYNSQNPYVGRDRRFYKWIVYDGAPYKMDWMPTTDIIYTRIDKVKPSLNEVDLASTDVSNTGYYSKKKLNPLNRPATALSGANYIYYRYTEVLLGYAEAQNEAVGPDASVQSALNAVRVRSGQPPVSTTLTQAEMRDAIQHERRVELCYENKRFFDIIRWRIAHVVMNVKLHGIKIYNTVPANNSGTWVYEPYILGGDRGHVFNMRQYLHPIPQPVIAQNTKLVPNPGY